MRFPFTQLSHTLITRGKVSKQSFIHSKKRTELVLLGVGGCLVVLSMFGHRLSTHFDITCVEFVHSSNSPFLYSSYGRYFILILCGVVCKLDIQPSLWTTHRLDMLRTARYFPIICAILWYSRTFY